MKTPESIVDRYTAAAMALDKEALLALYSPNIRLFDLMLPWQIRGTDEWAPRVDFWFANAGIKPEVMASNIEVQATTEMAVLTMNMEYAHQNESGERFGMTNRLTWVAVPDGDDWRIVHEHTSVPLDENDMMPQFAPV